MQAEEKKEPIRGNRPAKAAPAARSVKKPPQEEAGPPPAGRATPATPPDTNVRVVSVKIARRKMKRIKELKALTGGRLEELPLAPTKVTIEVRGIATAFASALRRAFTEMPWHCLSVGKPPSECNSTDPFMLDQVVRARIRLMPLRPSIPREVIENVKFAIHIENNTASDMAVYSGDMITTHGELREPIFNPTFEIGFVQPGCSLHVEDIAISEGTGREFAGYHAAERAALRHLDLAQLSRERTHAIGAPDGDLSGYVESSLVADPRHHELSCVVPAAGHNPAEARIVVRKACENIRERLRLLRSALEPKKESKKEPVAESKARKQGVEFTVITTENGFQEGILWIPSETATVANMIKRAAYEQVPDLSYAGFSLAPHVAGVKVTVRHKENVLAVVLNALDYSDKIFETIHRGI
jgi:hypothetical protein